MCWLLRKVEFLLDDHATIKYLASNWSILIITCTYLHWTYLHCRLKHFFPPLLWPSCQPSTQVIHINDISRLPAVNIRNWSDLVTLAKISTKIPFFVLLFSNFRPLAPLKVGFWSKSRFFVRWCYFRKEKLLFRRKKHFFFACFFVILTRPNWTRVTVAQVRRDKLGIWGFPHSQLQLFPATIADARQSVCGQGVGQCCSQNYHRQAHAKIFQNYCKQENGGVPQIVTNWNHLLLRRI